MTTWPGKPQAFAVMLISRAAFVDGPFFLSTEGTQLHRVTSYISHTHSPQQQAGAVSLMGLAEVLLYCISVSRCHQSIQQLVVDRLPICGVRVTGFCSRLIGRRCGPERDHEFPIPSQRAATRKDAND